MNGICISPWRLFGVILLLGCGVAAPRPGYAEEPAIADEEEDEMNAVMGGPVSEKEVVERVRQGVDEAVRRRQGGPLVEPLRLVCTCRDAFITPELLTSFTDALLTYGEREDVVKFVPRLLRSSDVTFSPPAVARLNLGVKLALVHGGASFEELKGILGVKAVDLEWLLPALGKVGGAQALPLIQKYREDKTIIPLGNEQNIRAVPCAAILAAAYAGEDAARETILRFYEEDVVNLPRFAFYVEWGLREGIPVGGARRLLGFCQHRIRQAERLLDFLGRGGLPTLIRKANEQGSISLTGYLVRSLQNAPRERVADYWGLLEHPAILVKEKVLERLLESGDGAVRGRILEMLRSLVTSPAGTDRLFAVDTLMDLDPEDGRRILVEALAREANVAVKVRLEDLGLRRQGSR
jgi:hypothetical protein